MLNGGKAVYMYKWDALVALQIIQAEGITSLGGVPSMITQLLEHPRFEEFETGTLEAVTSGGAPASSKLGGDVKRKLAGVVGGNGYVSKKPGLNSRLTSCCGADTGSRN
jgi:long-chain acyl-CoA synthetase